MTVSGRSSGPTPSRSTTPGRKLSRTTSGSAQSARPCSGSALRSITTVSLPALSASSQAGARSLSGSPPGRWRRTTRAPRRSSSRLANGPGRYRVRSTTSSPARGVKTAGTYYTPSAVPEQDKRRLLLDAAVKVFARKGYHSARVGDIAEEAGVAHGLLYHYFASKEGGLRRGFPETWPGPRPQTTKVPGGGETPPQTRRTGCPDP